MANFEPPSALQEPTTAGPTGAPLCRSGSPSRPCGAPGPPRATNKRMHGPAPGTGGLGMEHRLPADDAGWAEPEAQAEAAEFAAIEEARSITARAASAPWAAVPTALRSADMHDLLRVGRSTVHDALHRVMSPRRRAGLAPKAASCGRSESSSAGWTAPTAQPPCMGTSCSPWKRPPGTWAAAGAPPTNWSGRATSAPSGSVGSFASQRRPPSPFAAGGRMRPPKTEHRYRGVMTRA